MLHSSSEAPIEAVKEPPALGLSLVVPVFNEAESIGELYAEIDRVLDRLEETVEIIFVDDGSSDGSGAILDTLADKDPRVRIAHFRRNYGKSSALDYAFRTARGEIVITMDADLQDDPAEIPNFLTALAEGHDVVSGWKRERQDPISKTLPSLFFNWCTRKISGLQLHDFNCGFKAYRREALSDLRLYGELHRYIPALLHWDGFRVGEIAVVHRPRFAGKSKFGAKRLLTGAFDILTVVLTAKFRNRPLHFFGIAAFALGLIGFLALSWLFLMSVLQIEPLHPRPMLYGSILLIVLSMLLIATGLIGELIKSLAPQSTDYRLRTRKSQTPPQENGGEHG